MGTWMLFHLPFFFFPALRLLKVQHGVFGLPIASLFTSPRSQGQLLGPYELAMEGSRHT